MSYFVLCTFDLFNATSEDYESAYAELEKLGLHTVLEASSGATVDLPNTTAAGLFTGDKSSSIADDVLRLIKKRFSAQGLKYKVFISVADGYAWRHSKNK
ncbi:TPA: hypothetical protein O4H68_001504 [Vibrio alginolyticus]|uniref:hypothetical protein n=1 Tax=Vibrio alginolyticus TaxID=663 RepID=UPI003DA13F15|nr:hypothetical protein [Vibrio alginolyticus]